MRCLIRFLDAAHARLGRALSVLEGWAAELDAARDIRTCVGCGQPGTLCCDDCHELRDERQNPRSAPLLAAARLGLHSDLLKIGCLEAHGEPPGDGDHLTTYLTDSLAVVELVIATEERWNIEIDDAEVPRLVTFRDAMVAIHDRVAARGAA